jgi:hypothetical protein
LVGFEELVPQSPAPDLLGLPCPMFKLVAGLLLPPPMLLVVDPNTFDSLPISEVAELLGIPFPPTVPHRIDIPIILIFGCIILSSILDWIYKFQKRTV